MRCLYCGKQLALLKKITRGGDFCSEAHRQKYQEEYNQAALKRLLQAQAPTAAPAANPQSAPAIEAEPEDKPAAPNAPAAAEPEQCGFLPPRFNAMPGERQPLGELEISHGNTVLRMPRLSDASRGLSAVLPHPRPVRLLLTGAPFTEHQICGPLPLARPPLFRRTASAFMATLGVHGAGAARLPDLVTAPQPDELLNAEVPTRPNPALPEAIEVVTELQPVAPSPIIPDLSPVEPYGLTPTRPPEVRLPIFDAAPEDLGKLLAERSDEPPAAEVSEPSPPEATFLEVALPQPEHEAPAPEPPAQAPTSTAASGMPGITDFEFANTDVRSHSPVGRWLAVVLALLAAAAGVIYFMRASSAPQPRAPEIEAVEPPLADGPSAWSVAWGGRPARGYALDLFRPSSTLANYRLEIEGRVDSAGIGWFCRAADSKHYYALRLEAAPSASPRTISLRRYAVVGGVQSAAATTALDITAGAIHRIRTEVFGPVIKTWIDGQLVDSWTDDRLKSGGFGFLREAGSRASARLVRAFELRARRSSK
jgi:hypothetical protein